MESPPRRSDAQDLGTLLDAACAGPYLDELWSAGSGAQEFDYDPPRAGPYVQGRQIAAGLEASTRHRLLSVISTEDLNLLSVHTSCQERVRELRREQLTAFGRALREASPELTD